MVTTSIDDENTFLQLENQDGGMNANQVEHKSKMDVLNHALKMLSEDDAQLITLFYKGEQSLDEIGTILGVEPNTVKVRLHRARTRLKEKMEKHLKQEYKELV